jgi:hypothetical protein
MGINSISSTLSGYPSLGNTDIIGNQNASAQGTSDDLTGHENQGVSQNILRALEQTGISATFGVNPSYAASGNVSAISAPTGQSGTQTQALHQLMHDIFQAVQQGGSSKQSNASSNNGSTSNNTSTSSAAAGYEQLSSSLQNLAQQLSANSTNNNSQNATLNKLQSDFSALVQSVGGISAVQGAGLQNFLGNLAQNMIAEGSNKPVTGTLLNTSA